eukprot:gene21261-27284_t
MISVEHCAEVTTAFHETIARGCRRLKKLVAKASITDTSLTVVAKHCPRLEYLYLVGCDLITDESVLAVALHCPALAHLVTKGCVLTDKSLSQIAARCPLMRELFLHECEEVTDVSVLKIAECCPRLDSLVLAGCEHITDVSMIQIAKRCPNLRDVHLGKCSLLTDASVLAFAQFSHLLVLLDVVQCGLVTDASISAVIKLCPALCHLDTFETKVTCEPLALMAQDVQHLCLNARIAYEEINKVNVVKLLAGRTQLHSLSCNHPEVEVNNDTLLLMACASPGLQKLEIYSHSLLSDDTLRSVFEMCPLLHTVAISDCPDLSGGFAGMVAEMCPLLTALDLSDAQLCAMAAEGLEQCAVLCGGRLKSLAIANCSCLTDECVVKVTQSCPLLECLDLSFNDNITSVSVKAAVKFCPLLKELNLVCCPLLNTSALNAVVQEQRN